MTLKSLYSQPGPGGLAPPATTSNEAGGRAYEGPPEWVLTKLVTTGMLSNTYYVDRDSIQGDLMKLAGEVDPEFLAKLLVYARNNAYMRSNPIQLLVLLSTKRPGLARAILPKIIRNGGDLLDLATVVLSGQLRKEFGTSLRKGVRDLLNSWDGYQFLKYGSTAQKPSLRDVIRITHPKPKDEERDHLFRWAVDKRDKETGKPTWVIDKLPEAIRTWIHFQATGAEDEQGRSMRGALLATGTIPHEVATSANLTAAEWAVLAQHMPYMATLKNLATFGRHGVYEGLGATEAIAAKLEGEQAIVKSRQFPYRFMSAYLATGDSVPQRIKTALGRALEIATQNIPDVNGQVVVAPDVSGSMNSLVSQKSKVRYVDIAALVTAAVLRRNKDAHVLPFDTDIRTDLRLNADDTILTNAEKLAQIQGGGTATSAPFRAMLDTGIARTFKLFIGITDAESWADGGAYLRHRNLGGWGAFQNAQLLNGTAPTETARLWRQIRGVNPEARAILINIAPYKTDQTLATEPGITMVSGFSDDVFRLIGQVVDGGVDVQMKAINDIDLSTIGKQNFMPMSLTPQQETEGDAV